MNDTTNNFIQNTSGLKTSSQEEKLPYKIVDPRTNYLEKSEYTFEEIESSEAPDMTKGQWKKYYKRMGLE